MEVLDKPQQTNTKPLQKFAEECDDMATARLLADTAVVTDWELEDIISLWEEHNVLSPRIKHLSQEQYTAFQEGTGLGEIYE